MTSEPALISAAKTGNIAAVRQLLSASPGSVTGTFDEVRRGSRFRLYPVSTEQSGCPPPLTSLMAPFSPLFQDGRCALCWAAEEGHLEVLEVLVAAGASLNNHDGVRKEIMPWILGAAHTAGSPSEKPLMLWAERVDASPVRNLVWPNRLHACTSGSWSSTGCQKHGARSLQPRRDLARCETRLFMSHPVGLMRTHTLVSTSRVDGPYASAPRARGREARARGPAARGGRGRKRPDQRAWPRATVAPDPPC